MKLQSRSESERGAVAILVAFLAVVLVGLAAFIADFGMAFAHQRTLQNGVDAAALAAGHRIVVDNGPGTSCDELLAVSRTQALADAEVRFEDNASDTAIPPTVEMTCDDPELPDRVVITAVAEQSSPVLFGGIFGADGYELMKSARVLVAPAATLTGLRPFALCEELGDIAESDPDAYITINFENEDQDCGAASGNFGTLDLRPPPINGNPGSLEDDWVRYGYDGAIPADSPLLVNGSTGIPASNLADDLTAILDEEIVLPTYDLRTGNGENSTYQVQGFVEVKVCGHKLNSNADSLSRGICFVESLAPTQHNARFVQLQFVNFVPLGQLSLDCPIDESCDGGPLLAKLAD